MPGSTFIAAQKESEAARARLKHLLLDAEAQLDTLLVFEKTIERKAPEHSADLKVLENLWRRELEKLEQQLKVENDSKAVPLALTPVSAKLVNQLPMVYREKLRTISQELAGEINQALADQQQALKQQEQAQREISADLDKFVKEIKLSPEANAAVTVENTLSQLELEEAVATVKASLANMMIFDEYDLHKALQPLVGFLAKRGERIRGTELSYPSAPVQTMNASCLSLATYLSQFYPDKTALNLLLPTVKDPTAFADPNLQLQHFIMNDDDTKMIHVVHCLEAAVSASDSVASLVFKYTDSADQSTLSPSEIVRLKAHSTYTREFFDEIARSVDNPATRKEHLEYLIHELKENLASPAALTKMSAEHEKRLSKDFSQELTEYRLLARPEILRARIEGKLSAQITRELRAELLREAAANEPSNGWVDDPEIMAAITDYKTTAQVASRYQNLEVLREILNSNLIAKIQKAELIHEHFYALKDPQEVEKVAQAKAQKKAGLVKLPFELSQAVMNHLTLEKQAVFSRVSKATEADRENPKNRKRQAEIDSWAKKKILAAFSRVLAASDSAWSPRTPELKQDLRLLDKLTANQIKYLLENNGREFTAFDSLTQAKTVLIFGLIDKKKRKNILPDSVNFFTPEVINSLLELLYKLQDPKLYLKTLEQIPEEQRNFFWRSLVDYLTPDMQVREKRLHSRMLISVLAKQLEKSPAAFINLLPNNSWSEAKSFLAPGLLKLLSYSDRALVEEFVKFCPLDMLLDMTDPKYSHKFSFFEQLRDSGSDYEDSRRVKGLKILADSLPLGGDLLAHARLRERVTAGILKVNAADTRSYFFYEATSTENDLMVVSTIHRLVAQFVFVSLFLLFIIPVSLAEAVIKPIIHDFDLDEIFLNLLYHVGTVAGFIVSLPLRLLYAAMGLAIEPALQLVTLPYRIIRTTLYLAAEAVVNLFTAKPPVSKVAAENQIENSQVNIRAQLLSNGEEQPQNKRIKEQQMNLDQNEDKQNEYPTSSNSGRERLFPSSGQPAIEESSSALEPKDDSLGGGPHRE